MSNKEFNICPLCNENRATKKSSHIFPRFMGVSIAKTSDGKRKGFTIGEKGKVRVSQDSPKENYILCPNCESLIGKLETILANNLINNIKNAEFLSEFSIEQHSGYKKALIPTIKNKDLKRVILSMLLRAYITSRKEFSNCKLSPEQFQILRKAILDEDYTDVPMVILTSTDENYSSNFYCAYSSGDSGVHLLWINDYWIHIFFDETNPHINQFPAVLLREEEPPFIGLIPPKNWEIMRQDFMKTMIKLNSK
ncbi:MAG: hypothetical protein R2879_00560 [Saprospiraceae bacterium]